MIKKIVPAILEDSVNEIERKNEVERKVGLVRRFVQRVQIDIIDGKFADNLTIMPDDLLGVDFDSLAVDIHLMTLEPVEFLSRCSGLLRSGHEVRVIAHIERMSNIEAFVARAQEEKYKIGLALDLHSSVSLLSKRLFPELDCVLLMSVRAGFSGQKFSHTVLKKISKLRTYGFDGEIMMDGGMNPKTIALAKKAGANTFGITSYLWNSAKSIQDTLLELEEVAK